MQIVRSQQYCSARLAKCQTPRADMNWICFQRSVSTHTASSWRARKASHAPQKPPFHLLKYDSVWSCAFYSAILVLSSHKCVLCSLEHQKKTGKLASFAEFVTERDSVFYFRFTLIETWWCCQIKGKTVVEEKDTLAVQMTCFDFVTVCRERYFLSRAYNTEHLLLQWQTKVTIILGMSWALTCYK